MRVSTVRVSALLALCLAASACRDPESGTSRGPTKAPGAEAGRFLIGSEEPSPMRALGTPNRPRGEPLQLAQAEPDASVQPEQQPPAQAQLPEGVDQATFDEGRQLFHGAGACFGCHGQNGAGGPLAPAVNDGEWLHIDGSLEQLVTVITNGVPQPRQFPAPMPPRGGSSISDAQVRAVAAYVYAISR